MAERIKKSYRREARVIYPPVDTLFFQPGGKKEEYYVAASRLVPYKRMDLIVKAFSFMPDKRLLVIGSGWEDRFMRRQVSKNIEFLGEQTKEQLRFYLQRAKGFVFAAKEEFGILPVEAMACGTPVIGLGQGGLLETVKSNISGVFFEEPSVSSLCCAIERFEKLVFDPQLIRLQAESFSKKRFQREYLEFVEERYKAFKRGR